MSYFDQLLEYILPFKKSGYITFDHGATLYGHAPHIAPEAYNHMLFKTLNEDDISLLEKEIGTSIPASYRSFLLTKSNGLGLFVTNFSLNGLRFPLGRTIEGAAQPFDLQTPNTIEKPKNANDQHFFIGGYGYDASKLYIDKKDGRVHYCKRRDATSLYQWSSFEEMLTQEVKRIFKLFDSNGVRLVPGQKVLPI